MAGCLAAGVQRLPARSGGVVSPSAREKLGRRKADGFFNIPRAVMPRLAARSPHAIKLFFNIYQQYTGYNNGDFQATWRFMQPLGWKSRGTLATCLRELHAYGLIFPTRQGDWERDGRKRTTLWAVTFQHVNNPKGKLDVADNFYHGGYAKDPELWRLNPRKKTTGRAHPECQSPSIDTPPVSKPASDPGDPQL